MPNSWRPISGTFCVTVSEVEVRTILDFFCEVEDDSAPGMLLEELLDQSTLDWLEKKKARRTDPHTDTTWAGETSGLCGPLVSDSPVEDRPT
jgi:hypothetical protein